MGACPDGAYPNGASYLAPAVTKIGLDTEIAGVMWYVEWAEKGGPRGWLDEEWCDKSAKCQVVAWKGRSFGQ